MTSEHRVEIPAGYNLRELNGVNALFLVPDTWFFRQEIHGDVSAYFMSREAARGQREVVLQDSTVLVTSSPEHYFQTGLSVNVIRNATKKFGRRASEVALHLAKNPPKDTVRPFTDVERYRDGKILTARRFLKTPWSSVAVGERVLTTYPMTLYAEFTGNDRTGTLYVIHFETPSEKWEQDEEIARTMIEKRVLDPNI